MTGTVGHTTRRYDVGVIYCIISRSIGRHADQSQSQGKRVYWGGNYLVCEHADLRAQHGTQEQGAIYMVPSL